MIVFPQDRSDAKHNIDYSRTNNLYALKVVYSCKDTKYNLVSAWHTKL